VKGAEIAFQAFSYSDEIICIDQNELRWESQGLATLNSLQEQSVESSQL
jgi:hypothetical protein